MRPIFIYRGLVGQWKEKNEKLATETSNFLFFLFVLINSLKWILIVVHGFSFLEPIKKINHRN